MTKGLEMKLEELEKEVDEAFVRYYNKNFTGRDVEDAVFEAMKDSIMKLGSIYCQFNFLKQGLDIVLYHDKNVSPNLPNDYREQIEYNKETVNIIWQRLGNILEIVADRLAK